MVRFFKAKEIKLGSIDLCKGWEAVARLEGASFIIYTFANGKIFKAESDVMEKVEDLDLDVLQSDLFSFIESADLGIHNFATYQKPVNGISEFISYDCEPCTEEEYFDILKSFKNRK